MTTSLTDYTDALRAEPERWLGLVVLYSVADTTVAHADLESYLCSNGLDKHVPRRPGDADVFRRTCTAAQRKRQPTRDPNVYANVLIRDVSNDDDEVVKRVVVEMVDAKNRKLDYAPAYDLIFDKRTATADVRRIGASGVNEVADEVAMGIVQKYEAARGTVDGACIRTVIARVLDACHATSLREGGGSYFVSKQDAETVAGLERFAACVPGTMLHSIPLPDDPKQRQQLLTAVEDEAKVEIERVITEIANLLTSGQKISAPAIATFAGKYRGLVEKADRYAGLLESSLSSVRGALVMLDMQMAELTGVRKAA